MTPSFRTYRRGFRWVIEFHWSFGTTTIRTRHLSRRRAEADASSVVQRVAQLRDAFERHGGL